MTAMGGSTLINFNPGVSGNWRLGAYGSGNMFYMGAVNSSGVTKPGFMIMGPAFGANNTQIQIVADSVSWDHAPTWSAELTNKAYVDSMAVTIIEADDEADAISQSESDPNGIYFWVE
jgi:hypothetical protein